MILLDGKIAASSEKEKIKTAVSLIQQSGRRVPHLAAILVGHNGASEVYVANKVKSCAEVGIQSTLIRLEETVSEEKLIQEIEKINQNPHIDGILVQLPLPKHIAEEKILETIHPNKDVDGFHPYNVGKMVLGNPIFIPATPLGILLLLSHYNISFAGKQGVIMGRSNIVGKPMHILLSSSKPYGNATVTLCHIHTNHKKEICAQADFIIVAIGQPAFVTSDFVKEGAVVIDVGITRVADPSSPKGYKIMGDVDFDSVKHKASALTPVPGGVGLMTIVALLKNTLLAFEHLSKNK